MTFLTLRLWEMLRTRPYYHPLLRRVIGRRLPPDWLRTLQALLAPVMPLGYLFVTMFLCCASLSRSFGFVVFAVVVVVILFNGTLYGLRWGLDIAGEVALLRERGAWDLLALLPGGATDAAWIISVGSVHRENLLELRYGRHLTVLKAIGVIVAIVLLGSMIDPRAPAQTFTLPLYIFFGLGASYIDFIQSVTLGCLTGVATASRARGRLDAQLWMGSLFLAAQFLTYALAAALAFILMPDLAGGMAAPPLEHLALLLLWLGLFATPRELILRLLRRQLNERGNIDLDEVANLNRASRNPGI